MKVLVSEIPKEGFDLRFTGGDFAWAGLEGLQVSSYPHGRVRVEKSGSTVFVKGEVAAELVLICSRCLQPFSFTSDVGLRYTLRPKTSDTVRREVELTPEDLESGYYEDDVLQLERLLEEPVLLSIPMKPLCQDNCLGICPVCGGTRNLKPCHCLAEMHNSPFGVLREYFKESV